MWIAGTVTHLYCLGYVYDFTLRNELVAPAIWVFAWTACRRAEDLVPDSRSSWKEWLLVLPLLATTVGLAMPRNAVFLVLTLLNLALYAGICLRNRSRRLPLHLLFVSLVALAGGLPETWGRAVVGEFSRAKCLAGGAAGYFLFLFALSRDPRLGLLGALTSAAAACFVLGDHADTIHWAAQAGLVFLLLHSLRWRTCEHAGASVLRTLAALLWVGHSFGWMHFGGATWMACLAGLVVWGGYVSLRLLGKRWGPRIIPVAASLVMLSGPTHFTAAKLQSAPVGLLAVIGSFLLLGLGTLTALKKHRWNTAHEVT